MAAKTGKCDNCGRLISNWVNDLGYTLGHRDKNYCRFCYVRLRINGKIRPRDDDSEFMAAINWELDLIKDKEKRPDSKQQGECPACQSKIKFDLRGFARAEGLCPKCGVHIKIFKNGSIKRFSSRTSIILNVARHMGERPDNVQKMYAHVLDEISASIAENPLMVIPELGSFRVQHADNAVSITFKPSRSLMARIRSKPRKAK